MVDEIFDRHYQGARHEMNAAIGRLVSDFAAALGNAFAVLNRVEYSAPWAVKQRRVRAR